MWFSEFKLVNWQLKTTSRLETKDFKSQLACYVRLSDFLILIEESLLEVRQVTLITIVFENSLSSTWQLQKSLNSRKEPTKQKAFLLTQNLKDNAMVVSKIDWLHLK